MTSKVSLDVTSDDSMDGMSWEEPETRVLFII